MSTSRIAACLGLLILALVAISAFPPNAVRAQCDPAGGPCDPGGGEEREKKQRPTATDTKTPTSTSTPTLVSVPQSGGDGGTLVPIVTATETFTPDPPWYLTLVACRNSAEATAIATLGHDDTGPGEHETAIAPCEKHAPTATKLVLPPVEGPLFVPPGVKNILIASLFAGVLLAGLIIMVRLLQPPNPNKTK